MVLEEVERRRQETLATLADGELEIRELMLDAPISVDGYDQSCGSWMLFGGIRESLWTTYAAEPNLEPSDFVRTSLPRLQVQVVDFSKPYYSSSVGSKKIESVVGEINKLTELNSENVLRIYGVKRDISPKGWERMFILVQNPMDSGRLDKWLPEEGFGEDTASVGAILQSCRTWIDLPTEVHCANLARLGRRSQTRNDPKTLVRSILLKESPVDKLTAVAEFELENVLLCKPSNGNTLIKLSGTGYTRRLIDSASVKPVPQAISGAHSGVMVRFPISH